MNVYGSLLYVIITISLLYCCYGYSLPVNVYEVLPRPGPSQSKSQSAQTQSWNTQSHSQSIQSHSQSRQSYSKQNAPRMSLPRRQCPGRPEGEAAGCDEDDEDDSGIYEEMQSFMRNKPYQEVPLPLLPSRRRERGV